MGIATTNLLAVINNFTSQVSLVNAEKKGSNISNLSQNQVGNPGSMPIPWWYSGKNNNNFSENNIRITASGLNYYIWQYEKNVYYNTSTPSPGKYNDGSVLLDQIDVNFAITINSNGTLGTTVINETDAITSGLKYIAENITYLTKVAAAVASFCVTSGGEAIISQMTSTLKPPPFSPPNFVQQVLDSPAFSGLDLANAVITGQDGAAQSLSLQTYTCGITESAGLGISQTQTVAVAWQPAGNTVDAFYNASIMLGVEGGSEGGFQLGIWTVPVNELGGEGFGVTASISIGVGFALAVCCDPSGGLQGFTISATTGAEAGASLLIGATAV